MSPSSPNLKWRIVFSMTQADKIRQFALDHYVVPARAGGLDVITIRAGDIHREMNLVNAMPAVCSAVGKQ